MQPVIPGVLKTSLPNVKLRKSLVAQRVKNPRATWATWVRSLGWEGPLAQPGHGNPLKYSYPENPHGQRNLPGYSPWGRKESDISE